MCPVLVLSRRCWALRSKEGSPEGNARTAGQRKGTVYMTDLADLDTGAGKLGAKPAARLGSGQG